jgi:hypothetical protein
VLAGAWLASAEDGPPGPPAGVSAGRRPALEFVEKVLTRGVIVQK